MRNSCTLRIPAFATDHLKIVREVKFSLFFSILVCEYVLFLTEILGTPGVEKRQNPSDFEEKISVINLLIIICLLFSVVRKLTLRGYQPHLQELLLRLDFNEYYSQT